MIFRSPGTPPSSTTGALALLGAPPVRAVGQAVGMSALLLATVLLARVLRPEGSSLTLVWPAAAVEVVWLVTARSRARVVAACALIPATVAAGNLVTGAPPDLAVVFALANLAQAVVACRVGRLLAPGAGRGWWASPAVRPVRTPRDLRDLLVVALASSAAAAVVIEAGRAALGLSAGEPLALVSLLVRNTTSIVVLVPLVGCVAERLTGTRTRPVQDVGWRQRALVAVLAVTAYAAAFGWTSGLPLAFVVLPLHAWSAMTRSRLVVTVGNLVATVVVVAATTSGRGAFSAVEAAPAAADLDLLVAQLFMLFLSCSSLLLATHRDARDELVRSTQAALAATRRAEERAQEEADRAQQQADLLRTVLDTVSDGLTVVDAEGALVLRNAWAGRQPAVAEAGTGQALWPTDATLHRVDGSPLPHEEVPVVRALRGQDVEAQDLRMRTPEHPEGLVLSVSARRLPAGGEAGRSGGVVVAYRDVTAERTATEQITRTRDLLDAVLASATRQSVIATDVEGLITLFNVGAEQMLGWSAAEVVGTDVSLLHHPADFAGSAGSAGSAAPSGPGDAAPSATDVVHEGLVAMAEVVRAEGHCTRQLSYRRRDGALVPVELTVTAMRDGEGGVSGFVGIASDIGERLATQRQLEHQATHDALTGLANRRLLVQRLRSLLEPARQAEPGAAPVALVLLDLDGFKAVNDSAGHEVGDDLLCQVAQRLRASVRPRDLVARLGGDEFAVVCSGSSSEDVGATIAPRLLMAVAHPVVVDGRAFSVGASIGVADARGGASVDELLRRADRAMYAAKRGGKNRVQVAAGGPPGEVSGGVPGGVPGQAAV
ncbi:diguanylate cyclase domain-containing protein [Quadrisphaera sp. KR29]|uniref:diguanylate cyclase domain-containing protein n=1 Tax=Quadrisphaera sp. KR29 TaxID=3461391 RepID=UPI004044FDCA